MFQSPSPRTAGVLTNDPIKVTGNPRTVTHFAPCQMVAVQYIDAGGQAREAVVVKVGDKWYMPPNSEQWFGALREASPWLASQCTAQENLKKGTLPKEDVVDLFSEAPRAETA